jgi:hypothetical protein
VCAGEYHCSVRRATFALPAKRQKKDGPQAASFNSKIALAAQAAQAAQAVTALAVSAYSSIWSKFM